jgi:triacylglycerol esterase/lipase EstA (alpha/beta hydrolase family)
LLIALAGAARPGEVGALSRPPHPIIFVHGLASSAEAWAPLAGALAAIGWTPGGVPTFYPGTGVVTGVLPGDFYRMNFSDYNAGVFRSQNLSFDRQGFELAAIIEAVIDANPGASQVILVTHSMGGLAAREYLQGLARLDRDSARVPYRGDVAPLVASRSDPNLGSPFARCAARPDACEQRHR